MIWFFLALVAFLYVFAHSLIVSQVEMVFYWKKGLIPPWTRNYPENYSMICIGLAALLVQRKEIDHHPKLKFLYDFVLRHRQGRLPLAERDSYFKQVKRSLVYFSAHPIQVASAAKWMLRHDFKEKQKTDVLRLLAGFAMVSGEIPPEKQAVVEMLANLLSVSGEKLEKIIGTLKDADRKYQQQQQNASRPGERARCCMVLEISKDASFEEIRKAYRKLAQKYHPDKFANASREAHDAAHQKFLQIREAYETLEIMSVKS